MTLQSLTQSIIDSRSSIRKSEDKIIKQLDAETMACKVFWSLSKFLDGHQKLTNYAGSLGGLVLECLQNDDVPEAFARKQRISVGLHFIKLLLEIGIIEKYNNHTDGVYYLKPKTETVLQERSFRVRGKLKTIAKEFEVSEFFDELMLSDTGEYLTYKRPVFYAPTKRERFFQADQGELVTNVSRKNRRLFSQHSSPMIYDAIDNIQKIAYETNNDVLEVINSKEASCLLSNKHISPERRVGKDRDNNIIIDMANWCSKDVFYLHWYYDSRGRMYCRSEFFTPQGSKLAKSLFYFHEAEELGKDGWNALLMHFANTVGYDKLLIEDRIAATESILELIVEIFTDPIENMAWWASTESPWETLAAGIEIANAVNSGNEYTYESGLPIGLDATTSAFQWIGGMLRDEELCLLSNLTDSNIIGDSYMHIADYVTLLLTRSKKPSAKRWLSVWNKRRSICKRSVMIFGYTAGAKTMGNTIYEDFQDEFSWMTKADAKFLGELVYKSCRKKFPTIAAFMDLICYVSKLQAENLQDYGVKSKYSTFHFLQNYRMDKSSVMKFTTSEGTIRLRYISERGIKMDKKKISSSSPANTVHSTDKELVIMMINKLAAIDAPLFVVHDCFFTIPSRVNKMYKLGRESMLDLLDSNLLEDYLTQNNCEHLITQTGFKYIDQNGSWKELNYGKQDLKQLLTNNYCIS